MGGFPHFFHFTHAPLSTKSGQCDFTILTTLASPRLEAINTLKNGDILLIKFSENGLEAINSQGDTCGVILASIVRLKSCIDSGRTYHAKVVLVNGAECQVLIEPYNA